MESQIISMYGRGMSYRDIQGHLQEIYGIDVSPEFISNVTDKVIEMAREWQHRQLSQVYPVVFIDATFYNLKSANQVKNRPVYTIVGIDLDGNKECLGIWMGETEKEKAVEWLPIFNELQQRGVKEMLIVSCDNLPGISKAIKASFPNAKIQKCVVHQIRNSLKCVSHKDRKELANDLRPIYKAPTSKEGYRNLELFAEKWDAIYPHISKSWIKNWEELSTFFEYPEELRKIIYTTNLIESMNSNLKRVAKKRIVFPNEEALRKILYLTINN